MLCYQATGFNPAFNLALEESILLNTAAEHPGWFLLWRNGPSVIIGRHQNTWEEINHEYIEQKNIAVVRRTSGGGAVYHDAGNLNFSFLCPVQGKKKPDFAHFLQPIVRALADFGVVAEFSSRNDITVDGRKISGSAQRHNGNMMLHHGTLLYDLDMKVLGLALAGNPDKYQSHGVASHRSRVANLKEFLPQTVGMEELRAKLAEHCSTGFGVLQPEILEHTQKLAAEKYRAWDWNYGKSPAFSHKKRQRFCWGALECCFEINQGRIVACRLFGDFFSQRDVAELEAVLAGIIHEPASLKQVLARQPLEEYFVGSNAEELIHFISEV